MAFNNIFGSWGQGPAPSVFGALPYPTPAAPANFVTFYLTSFNPNVLNCTVIGPQQATYYTIFTDPNMSIYTVLKDAKDRNIGLVEWSSAPRVELRGSLSKQDIKDWLQLSNDKASRTMDVHGVRYLWIPQDHYINLYSSGSTPRLFARICRGHGTITLDISSEAIQLGLLDCTVMATLLLQCGKNVD